MAIEITVPLHTVGSIHFDVDEGEAVTKDMIAEAIEKINRHLDAYPLLVGAVSFSVQIYRDDKDSPLEAYDQETQRDWEMMRGDPAAIPTA